MNNDETTKIIENVARGLQFVSQQVDRQSQQIDMLSESLATLMYCLEQGKLDFEFFAKSLPEIQARRLDKTLLNMFEQKLLVRLETVEQNCNVITSGWKGEEKTVLRKNFAVGTESPFIGKKVGEKVKVDDKDENEYEVIYVYRPANQ